MVNKNNVVVKTIRRGNGGGPNIKQDDLKWRGNALQEKMIKKRLLLMLQELQEKEHKCSSGK